jgi:hypothetical protein
MPAFGASAGRSDDHRVLAQVGRRARRASAGEIGWGRNEHTVNRPDFACDGRAVVKCPDTHSDIHRIPNKIVLGVIEPEFDAPVRVGDWYFGRMTATGGGFNWSAQHTNL